MGDLPSAREAAANLGRIAPNLTTDIYFGGTPEDLPHRKRNFEAAKMVGIPITPEDLQKINASANPGGN